MPYGPVEWPSIGIGLLIAAAKHAGLSARALYPSLWFAERIGYERYFVFSKYQRAEPGLADWTFAEACFPGFESDYEKYLSLALAHEKGLLNYEKVFGDGPEPLRAWLWRTRDAASEFVEVVTAKVLRRHPRIVGCSAAFHQNCASLAVLRKIKAADSGIVTLLGGPSCEGEMGLAMKRAFPWVDYVVSGEADSLFADLCKTAILHGADAPSETLPRGVFSAANAERIARDVAPGSGGAGERFPPPEAPTARVTDLDALPDPDYADYFEERECAAIDIRLPRILLFETSRGCWKGNRRPCTFCGLNGNRRIYRHKRPDSVLGQLARLRALYGTDSFMATDTILNNAYFETVLPRLAGEEAKYKLFFETISTLTEREVALLADAGIHWIQPGIESLSEGIAALLDKGNSVLGSIALLKYAKERGIRCSWHILYCIPNDEVVQYREMITLMPLLHHLEPPTISDIRIDRFSRYFNNPQEFGLTIEPYPTDTYLWDAPEHLRRDLANFFYAPELASRLSRQGASYRELGNATEAWRSAFWGYEAAAGAAELLLIEDGEAYLVKDTRPCAVRPTTRLTGLRKLLYETCRAPQSARAIHERLAKEGWDDAAAADRELGNLVDEKLMVTNADSYLALATAGPLRPLPRDFPLEAENGALFDWLSKLEFGSGGGERSCP